VTQLVALIRALVHTRAGGTNTDGVLLSNTRSVVATVKTPTTGNVHDGIEAAIRQLLDKARLRPAQVEAVMIGTTQFVNAVVERSDKLAKVAVLRLCGPSSHAIPSFAEVPAALRRVLFGHAALLSGGCEYDGSDIAPLDEKQLAEQAALLQRLGLRDVVVAGVFSPASPAQELRAGEVLSKAMAGCRVTLSHRVASSGLLERENAAILNAAIKPLAQQTIRAFRSALDSLGFARGCPLFLSQNDGTLLSAEAALQTPVLTFASGPTNRQES
jgi:N-methylhydantoinase A/oxoprolinase/acetone carboxylase beta subunit